MSDTPETDAAALHDGTVVSADVARQLERERDEAREAAERYRRKTLSQDAEIAEARAALREIRNLIQRPAAWGNPNNVSGSLVAIDDICEEAK